jgi:hypothetical protein
MLMSAAAPWEQFNGQRDVHQHIPVQVAQWHNKEVGAWRENVQTVGKTLNGVPFGLVALLALDQSCTETFSYPDRAWTLTFKTSHICAAALEVKFARHVNEEGAGVGIRMTYSHNRPGQLTLTMMPACHEESYAAEVELMVSGA